MESSSSWLKLRLCSSSDRQLINTFDFIVILVNVTKKTPKNWYIQYILSSILSPTLSTFKRSVTCRRVCCRFSGLAVHLHTQHPLHKPASLAGPPGSAFSKKIKNKNTRTCKLLWRPNQWEYYSYCNSSLGLIIVKNSPLLPVYNAQSRSRTTRLFLSVERFTLNITQLFSHFTTVRYHYFRLFRDGRHCATFLGSEFPSCNHRLLIPDMSIFLF